jgi:hypothetical protein
MKEHHFVSSNYQSEITSVNNLKIKSSRFHSQYQKNIISPISNETSKISINNLPSSQLSIDLIEKFLKKNKNSIKINKVIGDLKPITNFEEKLFFCDSNSNNRLNYLCLNKISKTNHNSDSNITSINNNNLNKSHNNLGENEITLKPTVKFDVNQLQKNKNELASGILSEEDNEIQMKINELEKEYRRNRKSVTLQDHNTILVLEPPKLPDEDLNKINELINKDSNVNKKYKIITDKNCVIQLTPDCI